MKERTLDAIAMGPIGNRQGGFYALDLTTGQRIKRRSATPIPTPQSVIDKVYGKITPLTISTGKVHEYLGMEIDFSKKGKVTYSQYSYINEMLFSVSKYKDMQGESPTPASLHLFQNDDEAAVPLPEDQADLFHHYVAQL